MTEQILLRVTYPWHQKLTVAEARVLRSLSFTPVILDNSSFDLDAEEDESKEIELHWQMNGNGSLIAPNSLPLMPRQDVMTIGGHTTNNALNKLLSEFGNKHTTIVNERCSVAVPGLGMLTINDVKVANDFCTEALNDELKNGWRIVAVCVQPDQRRPDYVLGRSI